MWKGAVWATEIMIEAGPARELMQIHIWLLALGFWISRVPVAIIYLYIILFLSLAVFWDFCEGPALLCISFAWQSEYFAYKFNIYSDAWRRALISGLS